MNYIEILRVLFACALAGICIVYDIREYRIPNVCLLVFLIPAIIITIWDYHYAGEFILGLIVPLVIMFPIYKFRGIGAGDVKLMAVLGLFIGVKRILGCMVISLVAAGIMSVVKFIRINGKRNILKSFISDMSEIGRAEKVVDIRKELRIHYAIAIGLGLIIVILTGGVKW